MIYKELTPSAQLRAYIKCYWVLEGRPSLGTPELILPDGCPEIVFNLAAQFNRHYATFAEAQPRSIVVGQIRQHVAVEPTGNVKLFGVRFKPNGLYHLVRQPIEVLTDKIDSMETVLGAFGREIEDRILHAASSKERVFMFEKSILNRLEDSKGHHLASTAARIIVDYRGQIRICDLANALDTNSKTIERIFRREIGITPKFFCRITRLQGVLQVLNSGNFRSWADLAYSFGYFDQAHFINDFREFAGVSPNAFISRNNAISDSFVG